MKRIFILSALAIMAFAACKKKLTTVSTIVTVSYPKITISSPKFYSIPVGGTLPGVGDVVATAYDSFYQQTVDVVVDASKLSSLTPGLYTITVSAKNQYGYKGYENVYVAVTDVPDTVDIGGLYYRNADTLRPAMVTKVGRGLYHTSNLGGVDTGTQKTSIFGAYFVMVDNTTVDLGYQYIGGSDTTAADAITGSYGALDRPANKYSYAFSDIMGLFGTGIRNFYK